MIHIKGRPRLPISIGERGAGFSDLLSAKDGERNLSDQLHPLAPHHLPGFTRPGTILVFLEPINKGGLEGVTAGSSCIVDAYTSNHELISSGKLSAAKSFGLHAIDAVGLVHALLLRIQALLLPIKTLVLSGH